jgi:tetratricopeptide (TPR) repeat protein
MRYFLSLLLLFLLNGIVFAQFNGSTVDSLINEGITKHELGLYSDAIRLYKQALELNPKNSSAAYELSFTYFTVKDFKDAIKYARISIVLGDHKIPEAYVIWGSALDESGKNRQSQLIYRDGIQYFPGNCLLHYNLGLTLFRQKMYPEAETALINAVEAKSTHPGSQLLLGLTENRMEKRLESILPLTIFLLLEPASDRSLSAWETLASLQVIGVSKYMSIAGTSPIEKGDSVSMESLDDKITRALALNLSGNSNDTSALNLFSLRNKTIYEQIPMLSADSSDIWYNFYLPFFYNLNSSGNALAFSYYISQGSRTQESRDWFANHPAESKQFANWFAKQEFLK